MVAITTWLHFHEFYGRKIPNMSDLQLHEEAQCSLPDDQAWTVFCFSYMDLISMFSNWLFLVMCLMCLIKTKINLKTFEVFFSLLSK